MRTFRSIFIIFAVAVSFVLVAVERSAAQAWGEGPVVVYDQQNGGGRSQSFSIGEFQNNRGQLGSLRNDSAASVHVADGYRVRFCENEGRNGTGRCEEFGPGYHNLRYQRMASYIRVWTIGGGWGGGSVGGRGVTVYDDRDFRGRSQTFGPGRYLNNTGSLGAIRNDEASSVIVERGFRVRFCESEGTGNGGGQCEELGEGRHNLRLNDEASYIEVRREGGWGGGGWGGGNSGGGSGNMVIVYSERDQRGDEQSFGVGTFRNDQRGLGNIKNDDATSIYVPRGYRVRICDNDGSSRGSGQCEEYGPGSRNLRYNDRMSYIRVWRTIF